MRRLVVSLALSVLALGCGDPDPSCEPACRDGFACVRGTCVSACNPACGAGETCTADARCVPADGPDTGVAPLDSGPLDASPVLDAFSLEDVSSIDAAASDGPMAPPIDASATDAGPLECEPGTFLCGGACVPPTPPAVGVRTPTTGRYGMDWFDSGDLAVDPCTGTMGLVYAQQISGSNNDEIFFVVIPPELGATVIGPVRVTTAPGPASDVAIAWAGDRFLLFWSDPRHDAAPESCTRCLSELYTAAYDRAGAMLVTERRLTTYSTAHRVASIRAASDPSGSEVGVTWVSADGTRQVFGGIVGPDGAMRAQQVVSAAPMGLTGNTPSIVWNEGWVILYRHDEPDGSRPDYLHTRTLGRSGLLSTDLDLRVPAEQIALTSRGAAGYATVTTGGSALALRLWDAGWTATTTLPITSGTFDGSRGLGWNGSDLFVTDAALSLSLVRRNGLGTETGRILLTSDPGERAANDLRMIVLGDRIVLEWVHATMVAGSVVRHRIQVVDVASAM